METELQQKPLQKELFSTPLSTWNAAPATSDGRDELNLAEFPLAALSSRGAAEGQKTLEFRDTIFDRQAGQLVERKLTVTAADKFGLPNAIDDEIILGLIQLSKRDGFTNKIVPFSRYEIIRILGWEDQTWNYHRIIQALDRWTGVTLKYENAWWDAERKCWVNETFHILERLTEIKDADGKERAAFVWSDVIFSNLQKGHLKTLDLNIYRRLNNPVSKRLYRLLDKRFYYRRRVEFDLVELAYHKLGISKTYRISNIKQRIQPAINELEAAGVIKPASSKERYEKHGVKEWHVIFVKADQYSASPEPAPLVPLPQDPVSETEAALIKEGVSPKKARRLVTTMPEDYLRLKIDEFRYLVAQNPGKVANPAGYLVKAIEDNYATPKDYKSAEERAQEELSQTKRLEELRLKKEKAAAREKQKQDAEKQKEAERTRQVEAYLNSLSEEERGIFEAEILQREKNRSAFPENSQFQAVYLKIKIEDEVMRILAGK